MTEEADRYKEDDKRKRELVEARNNADALIHSTEKTVKELGDKVAAGDKSTIEAAIASLKTAAQGDDVNDIKAKLAALGQASLKLGEAVYGGAQAGSAGEGGAGAQGGSGDNVVDADFEEVKDDKKKSA
jgi:molecular chaperone DnaK